MDEKEIEALAEELAEIAPELAEGLAQMTPSELHEFFQPEVRNVLDEPLSEETGLQPPLLPKPFQPRAPPRRRRNRRQDLPRLFDPLPPQNRRRNVMNYQNEIQNVHDVLTRQGGGASQGGASSETWVRTTHPNS